ncbi:MAG TPA: citramalate synthase [Solirubrobacterales bacterium]|nr:citramalate synthase [Solirubrobacterales bacterium]
MEQVKLYDTTLRDGMQGHGMSLSAAEKVRVVHALDRLGVQFVEAGFPSSNPKEAELFALLAEETFEQTTICAFGMTRRRGVEASEDEGLKTLAATFAPVVTLVGKTWSLHLEKVTKVSPEENLAMIGESVRFLVEQGKRVIYDAEHFFDAWRDDPAYSLECLRAAVDAGAENLSLCDTNGSSLPGQIASATREVKAAFGDSVELGCHVHNDAECGVANSLAAVNEGVRLVQGTMNGYGERCGNANLVSILPALQLKMGYDVVSPEQLAQLSTTSHFLAELLNVPLNPDQAYVGRNAFAHKGGMHVAGIAADSRTFEHLEPALVGNQTSVLPSELSGKATILQRAESIGLEMDDETARQAIEQLKEREHEGYHYEAAEASFDLLLRKLTGEYEPLFKLEGFRVITEMREGGEVETEATLKILVQGERQLTVAEGNGPVNALDKALRMAITKYHPHLADIELTGYRVRILDSDHGTGAGTRVLLDSTDGDESWGSIGVSENIIEASWEALVDSLEYAFPKGSPK